MERLTYDFAANGQHCWQVKGADNSTCDKICADQGNSGCKGCPIAKAFTLLAEYENTGLTPKEIQPYASMIKEDIEHSKEFKKWLSLELKEHKEKFKD